MFSDCYVVMCVNLSMTLPKLSVVGRQHIFTRMNYMLNHEVEEKNVRYGSQLGHISTGDFSVANDTAVTGELKRKRESRT